MEDFAPNSSGGVAEMEKTVTVEQIKEEPVEVVILNDDAEIGRSSDGGSGGGGGDALLHSTIPPPKPMEGLHQLGPPPFLQKMYKMVEDPKTSRTISWSPTGKSFIIWDPHTFSCNFLPKHFKHSNFSSFQRQLNTYGFKKIDPDRWEFSNERFQKGKENLLKTIKRNKHSSKTLHQQGSGRRCFDQALMETEAELETIRHDEKEIRTEIKKLKEQQEITDFHVAAIREQIVNVEMKQQQLLVFVSKAFTSPAFLDRFVQYLKQKKELCDGHIAKKPRLVAEEKGKNSICNGQKQEELTIAVDPEVKTLFSDSLDDDDSHILEDSTTPVLDSENYILWEKLLADDLIIGNEAETEEHRGDDPSMIVEELKSLIASDSMASRGKDVVEQVG